MMLLAMADNLVIQVTTACMTLLGTIFTGIMAYLMTRLNVNQQIRAKEIALQTEIVKQTLATNTKNYNIRMNQLEENANTKVDEVKTMVRIQAKDVNEKLDIAAKVGAASHSFLNSLMGAQLKKTAELSKWKAEHTNDPVDKKQAELDQQLYDEHQAMQALVDVLPGTDEEKKGVDSND